MAALSVAPEPEPEPVHSTSAGGIRAVVLYDYEVRAINSSFNHLIAEIESISPNLDRQWRITNCP
jgi:hypothetical protein